jgi:hypothetical protein
MVQWRRHNVLLVRTIFLERSPWLGQYRPGEIEYLLPREPDPGQIRLDNLAAAVCSLPANASQGELDAIWGQIDAVGESAVNRRVGVICGGRLPPREKPRYEPPPQQEIFLPPPPPTGGCPPNYIRNPVPPYDCLPPTSTEPAARPRGPARPQGCPPGWIGQPPNCLPPTPTGKTCPPGQIPRPVAPYDCITDVISAGLTFGPTATATPKLPPPPIPAGEYPGLRGFNISPWKPSRVHRLNGLSGPRLGIMTCYNPDGSVAFSASDIPSCPPGTSPTPPAPAAPPPQTAPTAPVSQTTPIDTTAPTAPTGVQPSVMPTAGIQQQPFFGPSAGIPLVPIGVKPAAAAPAPVPTPVPATVPCPPSPTILEEPAVAGIPVVPVTGVLLVGAITYLLVS